MGTTIRQTVTLKAQPSDVYEAFMNADRHTKFTGAKATVSPDVDGAFSAYDGGIRGTNVALHPGEKIVQAWQCDADGWPRDHFSELTITLTELENGTQLDLIQTDVPDASYETCNTGWREAYWEKMKSEFGW